MAQHPDEESLILLVFVAAISLLDAWQQRHSRRALAELARLSSPSAPQAPLFGPRIWRRALRQGERLAAVAIAIACCCSEGGR